MLLLALYSGITPNSSDGNRSMGPEIETRLNTCKIHALPSVKQLQLKTLSFIDLF